MSAPGQWDPLKELLSVQQRMNKLFDSALARTESRGSHQRTDYPDRDDDTYLKHSLAFRGETDPTIEYKEVTVTRWPPGERVYGNV